MKRPLQRLFLILTVFICLFTLGACSNTEPIGFNEATNQTITFQGMTFSIPEYYDFKDPKSTEDYVHYYPENEDYFSSIIFASLNTSATPAGFKAGKQPAVEALVESIVSDATIASTDDITVAGLSAIKASFSQEKGDTITSGQAVLINNIYASNLISVVQLHDSEDQSNFDYDSDFIKILESATMTKEGARESISNKSDKPAANKPAESSKPTASEMIGSGDLGDYHVEIKNGVLTEDYSGNPVCIITYSWTNNSDEATSAIFAIEEKAFQDGVELEMALLVSDAYDAGASMKEVKPGATLDVQCAFVLANKTSDVEIELTEQFDFSKSSPKVVKVFSLK